MAAIEVVVRLTKIADDIDIEEVQSNISDLLYKAGYSHIEPIGVTLITDDNKPCGCG